MKRLHAVAAAFLAGCSLAKSHRPQSVGFDEAAVTESSLKPQLPLLKVAWWVPPLVKTELLEYDPLETATPAVDLDSDRVIVSTRNGRVSCLDASNGEMRWSVETYGRPFAGASILDGIAYVPGGDGVLRAIDVATGKERWAYASREELVTIPVFADGLVIVASQADTLYAIDRETGKWVWQYRRDPVSGFSIRGASRPVLSDGRAYMGFSDGNLVALKASDGTVLWEKKLTSSGGTQFLDVDAIGVNADGTVLVAASYKDGVFGLNPKTGAVTWKSDRATVNGLAVGNADAYVTGDGSVTAIAIQTGRERWSTSVAELTSKGSEHNAGRPPAVFGGYVLAPTGAGLAIVREIDGRLDGMWNPGRGITAQPGAIDSPLHGRRIYVVSNLGSAIAVDYAH